MFSLPTPSILSLILPRHPKALPKTLPYLILEGLRLVLSIVLSQSLPVIFWFSKNFTHALSWQFWDIVIVSIPILQQSWDTVIVSIPILHKKKLKLREAQWCNQDHVWKTTIVGKESFNSKYLAFLFPFLFFSWLILTFRAPSQAKSVPYSLLNWPCHTCLYQGVLAISPSLKEFSVKFSMWEL